MSTTLLFAATILLFFVSWAMTDDGCVYGRCIRCGRSCMSQMLIRGKWWRFLCDPSCDGTNDEKYDFVATKIFFVASVWAVAYSVLHALEYSVLHTTNVFTAWSASWIVTAAFIAGNGITQELLDDWSIE